MIFRVKPWVKPPSKGDCPGTFDFDHFGIPKGWHDQYDHPKFWIGLVHSGCRCIRHKTHLGNHFFSEFTQLTQVNPCNMLLGLMAIRAASRQILVGWPAYFRLLAPGPSLEASRCTNSVHIYHVISLLWVRSSFWFPVIFLIFCKKHTCQEGILPCMPMPKLFHFLSYQFG